MTAIASAGQLVPEAAVVHRRKTERKHVGSHVFLIIMTVLVDITAALGDVHLAAAIWRDGEIRLPFAAAPPDLLELQERLVSKPTSSITSGTR